jgi:hypothetical protein
MMQVRMMASGLWIKKLKLEMLVFYAVTVLRIGRVGMHLPGI